MLLFILYFIFKLLTIFFWVCEFKVVIGCFRMLFLLYPRSEWNYLSFVNAENKFDEVVCWSGMAITWSSTFLFVNAKNLLDETMCQSKMVITWSSSCFSAIYFFLESMLLLFCDYLGILSKSFYFSTSAWIMQVLYSFSARRWLICSKSTVIYWEFCSW